MSRRFTSSLAALAMVGAPTIMKFAEHRPTASAASARVQQNIAVGRDADDDREDDPTKEHCGTERWAIKVGSDPEARAIDLHHARETTIDALRALDMPDKSQLETRVQPTEGSVFVLRNVKLTHYKREDDSDYHLVLEDRDGNTVIAEIPEAGCLPQRSRWRSHVRRVREAFDDQHEATGRLKSASDIVSVVGVGFFDHIHGQSGVAPNGIELHPLLEICFEENCKLELAPRR
jgi:hypothetical protein